MDLGLLRAPTEGYIDDIYLLSWNLLTADFKFWERIVYADLHDQEDVWMIDNQLERPTSGYINLYGSISGKERILITEFTFRSAYITAAINSDKIWSAKPDLCSHYSCKPAFLTEVDKRYESLTSQQILVADYKGSKSRHADNQGNSIRSRCVVSKYYCRNRKLNPGQSILARFNIWLRTLLGKLTIENAVFAACNGLDSICSRE